MFFLTHTSNLHFDVFWDFVLFFIFNMILLVDFTEVMLSHQFLELGITDGHEIAVADSTSPKPIIFRIYFNTGE